jgi:hypothetical protein
MAELPVVASVGKPVRAPRMLQLLATAGLLQAANHKGITHAVVLVPPVLLVCWLAAATSDVGNVRIC